MRGRGPGAAACVGGVRPGLIGGPGDTSDRHGYYVSRLALASGDPVLVPAVLDQPMQVIDVRDLATWVVDAAIEGVTGTVHGAGERTTVGAILDLSAQVAGSTGPRVSADPDWLRGKDVQEWMGPRSLPLWLPASHHGMGMMDVSRALGLGLRCRPITQTLRDVLDDELRRGLGRQRSAGLTRLDEVELIEQWSRAGLVVRRPGVEEV